MNQLRYQKKVAIFLLLGIVELSAQETEVTVARDGFVAIATDARMAGQGDVGVATTSDAFSQFSNASKYIFSERKFEVGITQILGVNAEFNEFTQNSFVFYNKLEDRSAYALSFQNYAYTINGFVDLGTVRPTQEAAIAGSYALRLSQVFSMSVGGRFVSLRGKAPLVDGFNQASSSGIYGIDVSGSYYGNEIAYKKYNARWRAGFSLSNLRGKSDTDKKDIEIYAPSMLRLGVGFDFIFDQDRVLSISSEYKTLVDSYVENNSGNSLNYGLQGSVAALGLEYTLKEKIALRMGHSRGINRETDSFTSLGAGFRGRFVAVDMALLLGLSEVENQVRDNFRISLSLDLAEVFSN